jgi:hypothetical protein
MIDDKRHRSTLQVQARGERERRFRTEKQRAMKRKRGGRHTEDVDDGDQPRIKSRRANYDGDSNAGAVFLFGTTYRANATVDAEIGRLRNDAEVARGAGGQSKLLRLLDLRGQEQLLQEGLREWNRLWMAKGVASL